MPWVEIDPTTIDPTAPMSVKSGKWVPIAGSKTSAGPPDASKMSPAQAIQQFEGGGLKAPAVDPIDVAMFAASGGASGLAQGGAKLATEQALKEGTTVAASEMFNSAAKPMIDKIPASHPLVRDAAQVATGFAPFMLAGAGPQAGAATLKKLGGAGEVGEAATTAATKAGEATENAQAALDKARASGNTEIDQKYEDFRQKQIPGTTKDAKQETIAATLGKTPEDTRATRFDPNAPQTQAKQREIIFQKSNAAATEYNKEYEDVRGQFKDKPADMTTTAKKAQELENAAKANNWQLSPSTRKLLAESKGLAQAPETKFNPTEAGYSPKQWARKSPEEQQQIIRTMAKMEPYGKAPEVAAPASTTIGQAIGLNSKWGAQMGGAESYDGLVAKQMRDAVLTDLDNANVPRLKELNNRYRAFRNGGLGDYDFLGKVSDPKGGELHNVMGEIIGNPQRGIDFVKRLTPEEKPIFRDMYADYINTGGKISPDHAPLLQGLGFKGPLTKPEAWVYADKATGKLADVLSTAPIAKKKFMAALEQQRTDLSTENSQAIVKESLAQAKKLGTTGQRISAAIMAAKTPEEQAKVALQSFDELSPSEQAQQAGVSTIQQFKSPEGGFRSSLKRRAQIYATLALPMAAMGRTTMAGYAATLGTVAGIDTALRAGLRYSLRDPDNASMFYRALINPGAQGSLDTIARQVVQSSMPAEAAQVGQAVTTKPGPMVKQVEHEKAVNIAGPRGAVSPERISRIEDLNKDIATGDAPEVHADLRNGRLTHTDIAKMVQPDKPGLAALFQGMTPQQAVDAFAVADPSERELALPALAQHIQNEGKNLKPEERQRILTQMRSVLQPQQEQTG